MSPDPTNAPVGPKATCPAIYTGRPAVTSTTWV
jgi:hypothetical protein